MLDPEGKPVAGATVYRCYPEPGPVNDFRRRYAPVTKGAVVLTRSGPDGSFRLSPEDREAARDRLIQVVVMADGYGPAFLEPSIDDAAPALRLVKDDVPIRGRVFDLQGSPVAGAKVQVIGILRPKSGKLDEWLEVLKQEKAAYPAQEKALRAWSGDDIPMLLPAVEADRDGRFTIKGIGRERIATLIIEGPGIVRLFEYAATREMPPVKIPFLERDNVPRTDEVFHGATPELAAGPGLEVVGTVRDKDTGKPLAGITVQPTMPFGNPFRYFKTTTNAKGEYRLAGLSLKDKYGGIQDILAVAEGGPPYVPTSLKIEETRAPGPIRKDFALGLGTWVRGRVVDRSTGKPVFAELNYYILQDNLHAKGYPRYGTTRFMRPFLTDEEGAFRIAVIPGKGILAAWAPGSYRIATGLETFQGRDAGGLEVIKVLRDEIIPANFNTLVEVDPKVGEESIAVEIGVDPGRTLKGKVVGPDGEPVAGTLMMSAEDFYQRWSEKPLPTAEFEVRALGPHRKRGLIFYHEAKNLAGAYVVKPDEEAPPTVKLEPCGILTGRLIDRSDLPQAGALLICDRPIVWEKDGAELDKGALPAAIKTDKDGRFRASGLVPGLKYTLTAWKNGQYAGQAVKDVVIRAGESRDLGDIKAED
ncbi:carboxypeptidase-like regulatory domain-containing protein [Singulisphaera sp. PoT]|uniref:carboxypeptidase-like regulatory domain-containing protein n=1 Tax=Singulisphaera sp. PoT TaxID=3411797 RepID=UPI003BF508F8